MYILGINGTPNPVNENRYDLEEGYYHDAAAALLYDGNIVAAFEEERLNRIKHTNKWPVMAINACLNKHGISIDQIDYFTFNLTETTLLPFLEKVYSGQASPTPHEYLQQLLQDQFRTTICLNKIKLYGHHYCHAATAFYPSPFSKALILTIDGVGEAHSGSVYTGDGNELHLLHTFSEEQSLGNFYNIVTGILGFASLFDEFKVMGLAPYGNPDTYRELFNSFYRLLPNGNYVLYNEELAELLDICPPGKHKGNFSQQQMDIAASLQETLETIVFHIVTHFRDISGCSNLCLAGGVALNCTMNGKLINSGLFDDVFVYPAANDSGLPVGSAFAAYFEYYAQAERKPLHTLYLGSQPGVKDTIQNEIEGWKDFISYERVVDFPRKAAEVLADDKVIGWVNGRSEFAPRALGNRSILADSRPERNKERINSIVKKREGFRPFAPSVMEEHAAEYFELPAGRKEFSHMTFVLKVQEKYRHHLGAVTHVDGTARIHTVSKKENPAYWELIDCFRQITGTPVVLNTSFNNDVESIVDTVNNAIVCFLTTNLDYLFIEDFVISKVDFSINNLEKLYPSVPAYLLLRNPAPQQFEIANTFNKKTKNISPDLFHILHKTNSSTTLGSILDNQQVTVEEREKLLNEVFRLWESRLIILTPFLS